MRIMRYDVAVAGGGMAGTAAFLAACACGKRAVLIEKNGFLGGEFGASNIPSLCGFFDRASEPRQMLGGIAQQLVDQLTDIGLYRGPVRTPGKNWTIPVEPESVKYCLDRMTEAASGDILMHTVLTGAETEGDRILRVFCHDGEGAFAVEAYAFVDCTGNAELAMYAGAETRFGGENGTAQAATRSLQITGIAPDAAVTSDILQDAIIRAKMEGMGPFSRLTGSLLRWIETDWGFAALPSIRPESLDGLHMAEYERETRRQAWAYVQAFRKYVPGMEQCRLMSSGAALGMRETRHVVGCGTLTTDAVLHGGELPDGIGKGCWPSEQHGAIDRPGVFMYPDGNGGYDIPLSMQRSINRETRWTAGRTLCAEDGAFASLRVSGTAMVTGQAAGVAAALGITDPVQGAEAVREVLKQQGVIL